MLASGRGLKRLGWPDFTISDKASEYKYLCQYSSTSSTEMLANSKDKYSSSNSMNINTATDYKVFER